MIAAIVRTFEDKHRLEQLRRTMTQRQKKELAAEAKIESQLADVRHKIELAVDNITIAAAADVPGISRRLAEFRDQEKALAGQLDTIRRAVGPAPESVALIGKLWRLLPTIGQENAKEHRELLANALQKTIRRVTLRTTIKDGPHCHMPKFKSWSGVIEFHPGFNMPPIELTEDDIPTPHSWRKVLPVLRDAKGPLSVSEITKRLGMKKNHSERSQVGFWLRTAECAGRVQQVGYAKGWIFLR